MGVPKFFRWISERYPKINQPFTSPPDPQTRSAHFPELYPPPSSSSSSAADSPSDDLANDHGTKCNVLPEFDRLYVDMNGIIHCCSHNNASDGDVTVDPEVHLDAPAERIPGTTTDPVASASASAAPSPGSVRISEAQIFRNVCYYLDRIISDVAKPQKLVYLAIDGVAPRAKMNQQRSRRYRTGKEREIEATFYGAHLTEMMRREEEAHASWMMRKEEEIEFHGFEGDGHTDHDGSGSGGGDSYDRNDDGDRRGKGGMSELDRRRGGGEGGSESVREVQPGRYAGTFETPDSSPSSSLSSSSAAAAAAVGADSAFHSNCITPGTPFFERCTAHIEHYIKKKLSDDPRWADLTIVFSGPNVPGEGEHKIMDFIRAEKVKDGYDPNTRHCVFGQDGDLIMLGLATHEPHLCLLREEVVFAEERKVAKLKKFEEEDGGPDGAGTTNLSASLDAYMHNADFELLHMSVLRDYLAFEFETKDVVPSQPFDLEPTIDDFVLMTFLVGNDFLPHMPALDIADEAFDLLFYTYKRHRYGWLKDGGGKDKDGNNKPSSSLRRNHHPYLTHAGTIVSGSRLEGYLAEVGSHEDPYYDNKARGKDKDMERRRKADRRAGREPSIPTDEEYDRRETADRGRYREMLESIGGRLEEEKEDGGSAPLLAAPVVSSGELPLPLGGGLDEDTMATANKSVFRPEEDVPREGLLANLGKLLTISISPDVASSGGAAASGRVDGSRSEGTTDAADGTVGPVLEEQHVTDLKGRYYYDKFKFTPVDYEKHRALRRAYVEGLVWNLEYYYKGCTSWEWYYPYHYGPMLSDLVNVDELLSEISFEGKFGEPLKPYEQLLGCLPPSSADLLPEPYQWLMKSPTSPIIEFYPESFTVDMNGKRWPWEAVVLLPFIDSTRLVEAARSLVTDDMLTEEERRRNQSGSAVVFTRDEACREALPAPSDTPGFEGVEACRTAEALFDDTEWKFDEGKDATLHPRLPEGAIVPHPGFPTLKHAPVQGLIRRRIGINVFGMRSRYRTAILQMDSALPKIPHPSILAPKFVGSTVFFRYPFLQEGFVTAVSDADVTVRGNSSARRWTREEADAWSTKKAAVTKQYQNGEGLTGTGGWQIPDSVVTFSIRPLKGVETMPDGSKVKVYAKLEVEVPINTTLWTPFRLDPRFSTAPARLEKDPYKFNSTSEKKTALLGNDAALPGEHVAIDSKGETSSDFVGITSTTLRDEGLLPPLPDADHDAASSLSILPPGDPRDMTPLLGSSSRGYSTFAFCRPTRQLHQGCKRPYTSSRTVTNLASSSRVLQCGSARGRALAVVGIAAAALLSPGCGLPRASAETFVTKSFDLKPAFTKLQPAVACAAPLDIRGDSLDGTAEEVVALENDYGAGLSAPPPPPLEFAHGTTTLSFTFKGGIIAAVDSRASMGSFVGSKTTQKVLPVNRHILGTMAGGAADCSFWIRKLRSEARLHELTEGRGISVARASRILSSALYDNRGLQLSVGTMIMGFDAHGASIYYVDDSGKRIGGDMFSVGSGSTFALGILDTERMFDMTEDEAIALGIKAIRHATFRDAYSGGYIGVYLITKDGWRKVFSEDLALSAESLPLQ